MIKKFFLFLLLLSTSQIGRSITSAEVLNKVTSTVESAPSISLSLKISSGNNNGAGTLTVAGEKFVFKGQDFNVYYDGKSQWTHVPSDREVTLTIPMAEELAEVNPLAFLHNNAGNFKSEMLSSAKGIYRIKLISKKRSQYIRSAVVTVNSTTWLPSHVDAELSNGAKMTIEVVSTEKGKKLPENYFRFSTSANPGVELIDLR